MLSLVCGSCREGCTRSAGLGEPPVLERDPAGTQLGPSQDCDERQQDQKDGRRKYEVVQVGASDFAAADLPILSVNGVARLAYAALYTSQLGGTTKVLGKARAELPSNLVVLYSIHDP